MPKLPMNRHYSSARLRPQISRFDRLVYELYGLTEEEIRIVETGAAK